MSKLTVTQLAEVVEALRIQAATTAIDMADEIATLRAEIVSLKAMLAARPSHTETPGRLVGTPEQRRAAAQRLAARHPDRRGFTVEEVLAEVAHG
jgi:hypothetical protein